MHSRPKRVLRQLMERYGRGLLQDPRRLEGLLADHCGERQREIFVLVHALRLGAPQELLRRGGGPVSPSLQRRLSRRLQKRYAFSPEAADWAVGCWTQALGLEPRAHLLVWMWTATFTQARKLLGRFRGSDLEATPPQTVGGKLRPPGVQWVGQGAAEGTRSGRAQDSDTARRLALAFVGVAALVLLAGQLGKLGPVAAVTDALTLWQTQETPPGVQAQGSLPLPADALEASALEMAGDHLASQYPPPLQAWIDADLLNVRAAPGLEAQVVGRIGPRGVQVALLEYSGDGRWSRIEAPVAGWISNRFVLLAGPGAPAQGVRMETALGSVVQAGLEVFAGPDGASPARGVLEAGQTVLRTAVTGDGTWSRLAIPREGWVRSEGIQIAE